MKINFGLFFLLLLLCIPALAYGSHLYKEKAYQKAWCEKEKGVTEYFLEDKTRVDCLTEKYAIEFDFAPKWHEAIGQALYYARMTGKKAGVVLIIEQDSDWRFYNRLKIAAKRKGIKIWYLKPEFLEDVN